MAIIICPSCGGKISTTRTTCIHCGYKLEAKKACPECEESIDANASECPVCGYIFNHSEDNISILTEKETKKETKPEQPLDERYKKGFSYLLNDDGTYKIISISDAILKDCSEIRIPSEFNGRAVTVIGKEAFAGRDWITSISIPSTITRIDNDAFAMCRYISEVHITDLDAWRNIIFSGLSRSNPLHWGAALYLNGELVTELVISDGVIRRNAFHGCSSITCVTISDNIAEIGEGAFCSCVNLANIILGNGVTKIGSSVFSKTAIKSVTIPDNVTEIDSYAFHGCKALNSVTIPANGIHIHKKAFEDCPNLSGGIHKRSVSKQKDQDVSSTEKTVRGDIRETNENQKHVSKLSSTINLILTILTFITFAVGIVFLCTARIRVHFEEYADGTTHWITSNYIEAIFDGWDISPLCLLTTIGAILMAVALLLKMKAEIKHTQDDNKMIITDLLTLLVSAVPIVFSAITVGYYVNAGLLLFLILSSSSGILIAMHLLLLLIKKLV